MSAGPKDEKSIFATAASLKTPAERKAYLDAVCGSDTALRARLAALLGARQDQNDFLDQFLPAPESLLHHLEEAPGTVIDRYKLLERIGEGGMAVVYMAEQAEPIRRKVALKIIKLGMDTKQVIARFEAERQALAMMDHPNIAKVHDAGATDTGRPYFVMELVTGVSITEYCDANNLSTKDRLGLFIQVCRAVQHAHQKGIIHRDIKPSNVMVTQRDGEPVPKVIDFGIAKATNQRLTEKTLFTRYAHIVGTPAYMSPEQAELSDLDVDTRTDIYSLGVLLYELLTGTTPFSEEELRKAGYIEMQQVIREQEPARPSTKLSTLGETLTEIAKHRNSTPDLLRRAVRGDLDWIVMKSLEKDRVRRYETANGLAEDVRRHLEHEPVFARGPSTTYRLRKFLRRHRVPTLAGTGLAVIVVLAVAVLSMWNRGRLQLAEAEGFKHRDVLSQAREQYAKADREAALETIQPILDSRHVGSEAHLLQASILVDNRRPEEAAAVLEKLLDDEPEIAGAAHSLLARILWENTSPDAEELQEIEEHRRKAEALLPKTAEAHFLRAMTSLTVREQLVSLDEALQLDPSHYESRRLRAFTYYASRKYERMKDDAMVMTILRPRDPLGYSLHAAAWQELGRYPEAIGDYELAMAFTPQDGAEYVELSTQRCEVFLRMGEYERVIAEAQECLKLAPEETVLQYHTFCALTALGEYEKATALYRKIIASGHSAHRDFREWCMKYVFDTLEAGRSWHLSDSEPSGAAFLRMLEAEETYRKLSAKATRVISDGFTARWSPDGSKLAFSLGVHGYSGVAIYEPATEETDLLIVPGKDPRWSPDGQYIAFVRDRQNLRLEELVTPDPDRQQPPVTDEEVWLMRSDGTEPRHLVQGSWPSWGGDADRIYYRSRGDAMLCSISPGGQDAEPKQIMKCLNPLPSVSPDSQYVSYFDGGSLNIKDLSSQEPVAERRMPSMTWGVTGWSPTSNEVCLGGGNPERDNTGLWLYDLETKEFLNVLDGPITATCWCPAGTELAFCLRAPYREIWVADLDPNAGIVEALGPAQTLDEHLDDMLAFYTRRIETDPNDAYAYSSRARYHDYRGSRSKANADMRRWSAVADGGQPSDLQFSASQNLRRVINMPFDCQLVFSAERPVHMVPMMSVAFGQKGRCEMKLFEIPVFVTSLFGLCFLSGLDASPGYAGHFTFGAPVNLGPKVNSGTDDVYPSISGDGLELYFDSYRPGGLGDWDIWVAKRVTTNAEWEEPTNLHLINSSAWDGATCLSPDGLSLYFATLRGNGAVMVTRRESKSDNWGPPEIVYGLEEWGVKCLSPSFSSDNLEMYGCEYYVFDPDGFGLSDLWVSTRSSDSDAWNVPQNLGPIVNSPAHDRHPSISADGRALFFSSDRPGGYGDDSLPVDKQDIWITMRAGKNDDWGTPMNLGPMVNTSASDQAPSISADGQTLYFSSRRPGGHGAYDLWQVPIIPIVDFNGDGQVDGKDLLIMITEFGGTDALCDIGPYAWGDGVVDFEDLKVLAEHILPEDFEDPTLVSHWALDETEGMTAYDSAGGNHAMVMGNAAWQPEAGRIGGALAFDGVDDFVLADSPVELGDGPFSVCAWIKDGAPGQATVSPQGGVRWLYTNPIDGSLMTDLSASAHTGAPLFSDVVVTDGRWHRVVLVWDGTDRILCVDEQEAAREPLSEVSVPAGKLIIGGSGNLEQGSLWTGLIDDVRIYNRAVKP